MNRQEATATENEKQKLKGRTEADLKGGRKKSTEY